MADAFGVSAQTLAAAARRRLGLRGLLCVRRARGVRLLAVLLRRHGHGRQRHLVQWHTCVAHWQMRVGRSGQHIHLVLHDVRGAGALRDHDHVVRAADALGDGLEEARGDGQRRRTAQHVLGDVAEAARHQVRRHAHRAQRVLSLLQHAHQHTLHVVQLCAGRVGLAQRGAHVTLLHESHASLSCQRLSQLDVPRGAHETVGTRAPSRWHLQLPVRLHETRRFVHVQDRRHSMSKVHKKIQIAKTKRLSINICFICSLS